MASSSSVVVPQPPAAAPPKKTERPRATTPRGTSSSSSATQQQQSTAPSSHVARGAPRPSTLFPRDDITPLNAFRPGGTAVRPTLLEVGPALESAEGSELVRKPTASSRAKDGLSAASLAAKQAALLKRGESIYDTEKLGGVGLALKKDQSNIGSAQARMMDGHAEAAMAVLREFFLTRPYTVLLDVFRAQDEDASGEIDLDEFKHGMAQLNLDLTERDLGRVFHLADTDGSGAIDLDEFLAAFRTDTFARDTFFWSQARPRGMLERQRRVALAKALTEGGLKEVSNEEVMAVVQAKVDQFSVKQVFNSLDDDRSGRISVTELVAALRHMQISISETRAQEMIAELNKRVGDGRRTHMTYRSFTNAFDTGMHEGTHGSDEGVHPIPYEKVWAPPAVATASSAAGGLGEGGGAEGVHGPGRRARGKSALADPYAVLPTRSLEPTVADTAERDTLERQFGCLPPRGELETLYTTRGSVYESEIDGRIASWQESIGQGVPTNNASWRDGSGGGETAGKFEAPGASQQIDWHAYRDTGNHRLLGRTLESAGSPRAANALGETTSSLASSPRSPRTVYKTVSRPATSHPMHPDNVAARASAKAAAEAARARGEFPGQGLLLTTGVGQCLQPPPGAPAHLLETVRLSRRGTNWSLDGPTASSREHRNARLAARASRQAAREKVMLATQEAEIETMDAAELGRMAAHSRYAHRTQDWQQVLESRESEVGRMTVVLEPPTRLDGKWAPAPPHRTSHWHTITGRLADPPSRVHVKPIVSYRRFFPEDTYASAGRGSSARHPQRPVWGGDREALLSPR